MVSLVDNHIRGSYACKVETNLFDTINKQRCVLLTAGKRKYAPKEPYNVELFLPLLMGFTIDVWIYIVCVCMSGRNVVLLDQMRAHQHQHDLPTNLIIIINNINNIAFAHVYLFEHATLDLFTCVSERACFLVGKLLVIRTIHYIHILTNVCSRFSVGIKTIFFDLMQS